MDKPDTTSTTPLLAEAARAAREVGCTHLPDQDKLAACKRVLGTQTTETRRAIKRRYLEAEIGLSDAVPALVFDHDMTFGEAYRYLGL